MLNIKIEYRKKNINLIYSFITTVFSTFLTTNATTATPSTMQQSRY